MLDAFSLLTTFKGGRCACSRRANGWALASSDGVEFWVFTREEWVIGIGLLGWGDRDRDRDRDRYGDRIGDG